MSDTGSEKASGIGARLKAGRERMGLTLLQSAERLHVDPKVIEALEAERFDELGAPVYVRGHLRHYAELVGEPAAELVSLYAEATKPAPPDLTRLPKAAPESQPGRLAVPALLVLIGFVLIGVVWWVLQSVKRSGLGGPPQSAHSVSLDAPMEPLPDESDLAKELIAGEVSDGSAQVDAPAASARPKVSPTTPGGTVSAQGAPMAVTLRFDADSWVEVYDASGQKLFYDIGKAETQRTVRGAPPLSVTLGNVPGVSLSVNGAPAAVPAALVRDDIAKFTIDRSGQIARAARTEEN